MFTSNFFYDHTSKVTSLPNLSKVTQIEKIIEGDADE